MFSFSFVSNFLFNFLVAPFIPYLDVHNLHVFLVCPIFFLTFDFEFHSVMVRKCTGCDINLVDINHVPVVPVEGWFVAMIWSVLENVPCALGRNVYSALGWNVQTLSVESLWSIVSRLFSPVDFLHRRSAHCHKWVLKSPVIVLLSVSSYKFVANWFLYLGAAMLAA